MWAARRLREILLTGEGGKAALIAYIKSSLPPEQVFEAIGAQSPEGTKKSVANFMQGWSESMSNLMKGSKRMTLNGGKMAVLPPGTEVDFLSPKSSGGESLPFLEFLERQAAQGFGISYEQLKRSFEESNYSSARASMIETRKHLDALKAAVIDPFAGDIYGLWLEEAAMKGDLETLKNFQIYDTGEDGKGYLGMRFSALSEAEWIGQGRGQVDELKETQAAGLRIKYGLSSPSLEWAKTNGKRFQAHVRQMQRDWKLLESIGINMNDEKGLEAEEKDGQHSKADGGENERSNRKKRK